MGSGGARCPAGLLLTLGWLLLAGLRFSSAMNVTALQDPGVTHEAEAQSQGEGENDEDNYYKVEETEGPTETEDDGSQPFSESLQSVRLACIRTSPVNRFKYIWKLLRPDQQPIILANDSAILEVRRDIHPWAFECDTLDSNEVVASVRFIVYTVNEMQMRSSRPDTDRVLAFVLIVGVITCIYIIFVLFFMIINWVAVKAFCGAKTSMTEKHSDLSSMKYKDSTSLDQAPAEIPRHEEDALIEWNEENVDGVS